MSIQVKCGKCTRQFVAPDEVRGRRFKCPACANPIDVPYRADDPLDDLRWSEPPVPVAPVAAPPIAPEMTQREVFGSTASLPPVHSPAGRVRVQPKGDLLSFIFSHKLVLTVFAFCLAFIWLGTQFERQVTGVVLAFFGVAIGAGAWRSQLLANRQDREAEDWRTVERFAGIFALLLLVALFTWSSGRQIYQVVQVGQQIGFNDRVTTRIVVLSVVWLIFMAYFAFVHQMSQRHGFFKPAGWTYIGFFFLVWPAIASRFGDDLPRQRDPMVRQERLPPPINRPGFDRRPDPNANNRPGFGNRPGNALSRRNDRQPSMPHVEPTVPSKQQPKLSPKDYPTLSLGRLSGVPQPDALSSTAAAADKIAAVTLGEGADSELRERRPAVRWATNPDPRNSKSDRPPMAAKVRLAQVPLTDDAEVIIPDGVGPYVAVSAGGKETAKTLQVFNLLTGTERKIEGKIAIGSPHDLSADGNYFAAYNRAEKSVDVWSLERSKSVARIPITPLETPAAVGFVGADRLLIAGDAGKGNNSVAVCQLWNLSQATAPKVLSLPQAVKLSGGAATISPGGRYLAVYGSGSIWMIDLESGKLSGKLTIKETDHSERFFMKSAGLSFSPDGEELACLVHRFRGARIVAWNLKGGTQLADHRTEAEFDDLSARGGKAIECLPDHTGWLIDGRALVDAKSGEPAWLGLSYKESVFDKKLKVYGLADADHLIVGSPKMITTWSIPRDLSGDVERKSLVISADDLPSGMLPEPDLRRFGFDSEEEQSLSGEELESASRKYRQAAQLKVLAGSDEKLASLFGWYPAAKRPVFGLRIGLGAQAPDGSKDLIPLSSTKSLAEFTGAVGPKIVSELRKRFAQDAFGDWPQTEDSAARGVVFVGIGPRGKVLPAAKNAEIDVVVMLEVTQQQIGNTKRFDRLLRARISGSTGDPVWVSPALSSDKAVAAERDKQDIVKPFLDEVLAKLDELYTLKPLPELKADAAKSRLAAIVQGDVSESDKLTIAAELRHYQIAGLVSADDALPAYRKLFDEETASAMASGDARRRRAALEKWAADNAL